MPTLIVLVGPPGSGKSTYCQKAIYEDGDHGAATIRASQDDQGKFEHVQVFLNALDAGKDIIIDRMGFNKEQRARYIGPAKLKGYQTKIIVFHESFKTCLDRATKRENHPTVKDAATALKAITFFFKNYVRVTDDEADVVDRRWPEGNKPRAIICDLDGTLCDIKHRRHFVQREGKKDWKAFMEGIPQDSLNVWCKQILHSMGDLYKIVYCSGRSEDERQLTEDWLAKHQMDSFFDPIFESYNEPELFMRMAGDSRRDDLVKEILLDFEILTRYEPQFMIDDRDQVVAMWRKRGYTCLQCDYGNF